MFDEIDCRAASVSIDQSPSFQGRWSPNKKSLIDVFVKMTPHNFFKEVIIQKTSQDLLKHKMMPLDEGELMQYVGIWLMMSTCSGGSHDDFILLLRLNESTNPCPYNFTPYMSKRQFKEITQESHLTDANSHQCLDCFWEVRQMIKKWNDRNVIFGAVP